MSKIIIKQVQSIKKRRPNAITFENDAERIVNVMGLAGLQMDVIAAASGLPIWQVATRLKKLGVSVRDYRRGRSVITSKVIQALIPMATKALDEHIMETDGFREPSKKPYMAVTKQPMKLLKSAVHEIPGFKAPLQLKG